MTNDLFRDLLHVSLYPHPHPHAAPANGWDDWDTKPDPPADPRARALWAKQHQGHGPAAEPLRVRGRTTHYKEKR